MRSREFERRLPSATATDLRTLVETYIYPIIVCDEDGGVRFCNAAANVVFGSSNLIGHPLPPEWMDKEKVQLDREEGSTTFRLLWAEIMWEGNPAWYLVTYPAEAGDAKELKSQLEQSMEMAASEVERRQQVESERERLESKLRDLHQRSVAKLEAARNALEAERAERETLLERITKLKEETDELKAQLEEKKLQVEEAGHRSSEMFEVLQAELAAKQLALSNAEEKSERYRRVYEEIDGEMTRSQEQSALLSAKLRTAEARLDRAQRLLDGGSLEAIASLGSGADESEVQTLRERIAELEGELRRSKLSPSEPDDDDQEEELGGTTVASLEAEVQALRSQLEDAHLQLEEARSRVFEGDIPVADAHSGFSTAVEYAAPDVDLISAHRAEVEQLQLRLADTVAVVAELRLHKEQELLEARAALTKWQDLYQAARASSNGLADGEAVGELGQTRARIDRLSQQAVVGQASVSYGVAEAWQEQAATLSARVAELELLLEEAREAPTPGGAAEAERLDISAWQERISDLQGQLELAQVELERATIELERAQGQLERAQSEASPEELTFARTRISELELLLVQASSARPQESEADPEAGPARERLEAELAEAHSQLEDMARELRRSMEGDRETKKLAYADQLTGLPNYNLTGQYLQVCFERSGRGEGALALILIDLDNFRRVNDALGTKSGDELLRQVGARLQRTVTEKDTAIARRGEDEFMVVAFLEGATVDSEALSARVRGIAHDLLSELIKPFEVVDQRVQITASMGVALYPGPATDRDSLLEQAEHAMYKAKESGRARVSFYTAEIHQTRDRKIRVELEIRQAVADGQFTLLYQPILEIPSGKMVGVEALVRWSHPQRGLLEPAEFLSVAEEIGVIIPLSDQILSEALLAAKEKFMKGCFMSLNLSHRQLVDASFPTRFMKALERAQVKPNEMMVEVSERATRIDPERSRHTLAALSHWGVGIALDDFGSGSSELSLFREFPIKLLKIDGSLVAKLPSDRETAKLCYAIAQLAAALGIPVLAESVETREQLEMVASFGCQYAQGLFLRAPMSVNQLQQLT